MKTTIDTRIVNPETGEISFGDDAIQETEFPDGMEPEVFMDSQGREIPNPNPIVIHLPSGPVTDFDRVRELIRRELSIEAERNGEESIEEANDFEVEGDMFPVSPHEYDEDTEKADYEALAAEQERQKRSKARKKPSRPAADDAAKEVDEDGVQPAQPDPGDTPAS